MRVAIVVQALTVMCGGCTESPAPFEAVPGRPSVSPSGKYILKVVPAADNEVSFEIEDRTGNLTYAAPDRWAPQMRLDVIWDAADHVWVVSSDVGCSLWGIDAGRWAHLDYAEYCSLAPKSTRSYLRKYGRCRGRLP
jgi:hypothetical protein